MVCFIFISFNHFEQLFRTAKWAPHKQTIQASYDYSGFKQFSVQFKNILCIVHEHIIIKYEALHITEVVTFGDVAASGAHYAGRTPYIVYGYVGAKKSTPKKIQFFKRKWLDTLRSYRSKFSACKIGKNEQIIPISQWKDGAKIFEFKTKSSEGIYVRVFLVQNVSYPNVSYPNVFYIKRF